MENDIWGLLGPGARHQALYSGLLGLGGGLLTAGAPTTNPGQQAFGILAGARDFSGNMRDSQQQAFRELLLRKQLNAPTVSKPGDIARDPTGKVVWQNPLNAESPVGKLFSDYQTLKTKDPTHPMVKVYEAALMKEGIGPEGFTYGMDAQGNPTGAPVPGGPGDPAYQQRSAFGKAAGAGAGGLPFVPPVPQGQPGAGYMLAPNSAWGGAGGPVGGSGERPPVVGGQPTAGGQPPTQAGGTRIITPNNAVVPQSAFDIEYAKEEAGAATKLNKAGIDARDALNKYQSFLALQEQVKTGRLAPTATQIAAIAQSFGIDPKTIGLDKAGPAEALTAIANKLAVTNIGAEQGGIPANNFTEADREFAIKMEPRLAGTPEGNTIISEINIRKHQRTVQQAEAWADAKDAGKTWGQFQKEWRAFIKANPLYDDAFKARVEEIAKGSSGGSNAAAPPAEAVNMLKMNPGLAKKFDEKYGPGAAAKVLGR